MAVVFTTTVLWQSAYAQNARSAPTYQRIKAALDATRIIDTHEHLRSFDALAGYVQTAHGRGMNLYGLWQSSYLVQTTALTPWQPGMSFRSWWAQAKDDFDSARATSFYRYMHAALRDLYTVDFDAIDEAGAERLNDQIFSNYRDPEWLHRVITQRANIELMLVDPFWSRLEPPADYPFSVPVLNVHTLVYGFHPTMFDRPQLASRTVNPLDDPYQFARKRGLDVRSLADYEGLIERIILEAKSRGAVAMKTTLAYERPLRFERVTREEARRVFGRRENDLTPSEIRAFEDYIMWRIVELSARHEMPLQIHTGKARLQGSNPMLLVNMIEANPNTKFALFHGGYPWVDETAAIAQAFRNVWVDSNWLPLISYAAAKRAYREWLSAVPSDRILWGGDCQDAEGIYGAATRMRQCLAEVLSEMVEAGELHEEHALQIGRQILRGNALKLFPTLRKRTGLEKGESETGTCDERNGDERNGDANSFLNPMKETGKETRWRNRPAGGSAVKKGTFLPSPFLVLGTRARSQARTKE